jgi:threonine dehydratase
MPAFHETCSFFALHSIIYPRAVTEFIYRYDDPVKAHVFLSCQLLTQDREAEVDDILGQLEKAQFTAMDISNNELAKTHTRFMIGGRQFVQDERVFRFGKLHHYSVRDYLNLG